MNAHCFGICVIYGEKVFPLFLFCSTHVSFGEREKFEEVKNPVSPACPSNISAAKGVFSCLAEYICDDEKTCRRHPTTSRIWNRKKSRNDEKSVWVGCLQGPNVYSSDSQLDRHGGRKKNPSSQQYLPICSL